MEEYPLFRYQALHSQMYQKI